MIFVGLFHSNAGKNVIDNRNSHNKSATKFLLCSPFYSTNKTDPHWNVLKVVLDTNHSSPYVSNRVRLHFFILFILKKKIIA
jgi:hypothetical protein